MDKEKSSSSQLEENSADHTETPETQCECCKKSFAKAKILKYIRNSQICKSHYGSRFTELKKQHKTERTRKYRDNMSMKKREEINKLRREQEKKYNEEIKQTNLALAAKGLNWDGEKEESDDEEKFRK